MNKQTKKNIKKYLKLIEKLDELYAEEETNPFIDPDDIRGSEMDIQDQMDKLKDLIPSNIWFFLNFGIWEQDLA